MEHRPQFCSCTRCVAVNFINASAIRLGRPGRIPPTESSSLGAFAEGRPPCENDCPREPTQFGDRPPRPPELALASPVSHRHDQLLISSNHQLKRVTQPDLELTSTATIQTAPPARDSTARLPPDETADVGPRAQARVYVGSGSRHPVLATALPIWRALTSPLLTFFSTRVIHPVDGIPLPSRIMIGPVSQRFLLSRKPRTDVSLAGSSPGRPLTGLAQPRTLATAFDRLGSR